MRDALYLILLFTLFSIPVLSQTTQPNIIFILADDLGYGDLENYGQSFIETPNLNELAENGISFLNHYSGSTVCAPSRATLMTGMHTGHSPIRGNREKFPEGQFPLPDTSITIAKLLTETGYKTGLIGKWGLGYPYSTGDPVWQGFDNFFGYNCQRRAHHYFPRKLWDNQEITKEYGGRYSHSIFTDKALEFIEEKAENPFFLYLAYTIPHAKLQIPKNKTTHYKEKLKQDKNLSKLGLRNRDSVVKYVSMVTMMDEDIGRIVDKLDSLHLLENTIIFFSSDNGPHSEGGLNPTILNSSGSLRGKKRDLYEGGIRVPLIVSWKGKIPSNSTSEHVSAFWDFFPTITDLLNISNPKSIDGISYLPTLLDTGKQKEHDFLYWEFHGRGGKQTVLHNNWKIVVNKVNSSNPQIELYNLSTDPAESKDLSDQNVEVLKKMKNIMRSAHKENPVFRFKFER